MASQPGMTILSGYLLGKITHTIVIAVLSGQSGTMETVILFHSHNRQYRGT